MIFSSKNPVAENFCGATCLFALLLIFNCAASGQARTTKFTSVFTPVPTRADRGCKTDDAYIGEGDEFGKVCPGNGKYKLLASGFGSQINYGVVIPKTDFAVYFHPLESGAASRFERADLYRQRIVGQIEWRLASGVPFAAIVRVEFYKNKGAKTFTSAKNKAGEFVLVRGLKNFENLREDADVAQTAFDAPQRARSRADKFYEQSKK